MASQTLFEHAVRWLQADPAHMDMEASAAADALCAEVDASRSSVVRTLGTARQAVELLGGACVPSPEAAASPASPPPPLVDTCPEPTMVLDEDPVELDADEPTNDRWRYYAETAEYLFVIKGDSFDMPREEVADLVWWYTRTAGNKTQREVCRLAQQQHGRTLTRDYLRRMLLVMGITKDAPPWAPHDLARYTPDELSKLMFARLQAEAESTYTVESPREYKKLWQTEHKRARDQERLVSAISEGLKALEGREVPRLAGADRGDTMAVLALYDAHFGKRGVDGEGLDGSVRRILDTGRQLMRRIHQWGAPSRVEVVLGGDTLHVDAKAPHTTSGTRQDVDRSTAEILRAGILATIDYVDMARQLAPVALRIIPGNHDEILTFAILNAVERHYQHADDVTVDVHHGPRLYSTHGSSLLLYEHGEGPKAKDLGAIMAREKPREWGNSLYRYALTGHLHHTHEHDIGGITVLQVSTAANTDAWHDKYGYTLADKAQRGFIFDANDGLIASVRAPKP